MSGSNTTALSTDDLGKQIETLRADLAKLMSTVSTDVSAGLHTAGRQIDRTGAEARKTATNAVLDHPLAAVGIAAGLGLLLGLLARKG